MQSFLTAGKLKSLQPLYVDISSLKNKENYGRKRFFS